MAIFNGYREGFEKGYKSGKDGGSENVVSEEGLLKMMLQALKPESYTDTFLQGWKEGYRKGAYDRMNSKTEGD